METSTTDGTTDDGGAVFVRLAPGQLARIDALRAQYEADSPVLQSISRASVLRTVIAEGLTVLEQQPATPA